MGYTPGAAGGGVVYDAFGNIAKCSSGDGRTAIAQMYGLNLCVQCRNNVHYQEGLVGAGGLGSTNSALSFTTSNKNKNLRGT